MKTHALIFLALLLGSKAEETAQCKVLIPGEVKTWEGSKTHQGKTRYVRWGMDAVTMNEERIVENAEGSVRGRLRACGQASRSFRSRYSGGALHPAVPVSRRGQAVGFPRRAV